MFFGYEDKVVYPVYLSNQSFIDCLDLLLMSNHYVYIKDFNIRTWKRLFKD